MKEEPAPGLERPFNYDVVDVSKGFLTRIAYKIKVKASKLDTLLERRVKQHVIEEKQRLQVSARKVQTPTLVSPTSPAALSTPVRPRSPLKPHALAQTQLVLGDAVKTEGKSSSTPAPGESQAELSKTTNENPATPLSSADLDSIAKDSCSTGICGDSASLQNQTTSLPQEDSVERTMRPKGTNSDSCSLEQHAATTPSDGAKAAHIENMESEIPNLKLDSVRTSTCGHNTSPPKPLQHNSETLSSVQSCAEENGMEPNGNQEHLQGDTPKLVSPLQVNGNDGLGSGRMLANSLTSSVVVCSGLQPIVNSTGKVDERGQAVSLKDSMQQKPLVNGDVAPLNDSTDLGDKEPSKTEVESKILKMEQDYKPPLKRRRLDNNIDYLGAETQQNNILFQMKPNPVVKIIRMAPSPIPSAEESSLSDDFPEDNSNSGATDAPKTTVTQITSTFTTTTVVSTVTTTANAPLNTCGNVVSTSESSTVSTLMTKTTVTKISPSGHNGQSQDDTVTQEQKTTLSSRICKSTADTSGNTSVKSVAVRQEDSSTTKGRVRLLKFSHTKKTRSDTALPSYCKFVTKSNRKSIFVLPHDDLKVLARRGGFREVQVFSYNAKPAQDIWPYPSPRPTFGITWR